MNHAIGCVNISWIVGLALLPSQSWFKSWVMVKGLVIFGKVVMKVGKKVGDVDEGVGCRGIP